MAIDCMYYVPAGNSLISYHYYVTFSASILHWVQHAIHASCYVSMHVRAPPIRQVIEIPFDMASSYCHKAIYSNSTVARPGASNKTIH